MINLPTSTFAIALNSEIISQDTLNIFMHTFVVAIIFGIVIGILYRATRTLWR